MRKIILASASPRRKELLEKAGVKFEIRTGSGEEILTTDIPEDAVKELSLQKAERVKSADDSEGTLIVGADTIVVYDKEILGKPADEEEAVRTLMKLQGNTHQVYTGVTVLEKKDGNWIPHVFAEKTDVIFYPAAEKEIRAYTATGDAMDKAGSYGIQGPWSIYVKGICGDYYNVVGLPVARLFQEMFHAGIDLRG